MAFKYINPGYAELLSMSGGTTVTGEQYSKTGVSFWQPNKERGIELPDIPMEFYGKFDLYIREVESSAKVSFSLVIGYQNGIYLEGYRSLSISGYTGDHSVFYNSEIGDIVPMGALSTMWLHIKRGNDHNGILHVIVNNHEFCNKRDINISYDSKTIKIFSKNNHVLISNLIISDEEISPREQVAILPIQSTQTDMTDCGDGSYEATAANQEILQTVNVAALSAQYGADSRVTGISLLGNPAYRTAEGLCALTAIEKSGGTVTEYGRHVVEQNPASIIMDGRAASMTIAELTGRQFGWRAGT
jgi:hypothetical protein